MDTLHDAHVHDGAHRIVNELVAAARAAGCYKVILDCSEGNVDFYAKSGFQRKEVHMVRYPASVPPPPLCSKKSSQGTETVCASAGAVLLSGRTEYFLFAPDVMAATRCARELQ